MTLYEATIDDIAEHVTIKQMIKASGDGGFEGGTGPNFKELEARKLARKERVSSQIIATNDDAVNVDFSQQQQQKHDDMDRDDGCSPPRKQKRFFDKTTKKKAKKYPKVNKWKNSDRESSSSDGETMEHFDSGPIVENAESENEERNKRSGNQRTKRSSEFMVDLKNAKSQQSKLHLVDMGIHDAYHK